MSHRHSQTAALALSAALLAGAPLAVRAQDVPPPPGVPGVPGTPAPPATPTPPAPTSPTVPIAPGGGQLGPGIPPPPPPPPLVNPATPVTPAAPGSPSLAPGGPTLPNLVTPPVTPAPPVPAPTFTPAAPQPVTLRYKFTPGQVLHYTVTADMDGSVQAGTAGQSFPLKQQIKMTMHQTVKSVRASDGAATVEVQVDSMTMMLNGQAMPLPPQSQQQVQQPTTLVMTPDGKVLSYQAANSVPGMSNLGLNPSDMQNARALPDKAVLPDDTWRSTFASDAAGLTIYTAYTLSRLSSDGTTATIGQKLYGEFKPAKAAAAGTAAVPKMNGLMTGTGTEQFDIAAGQVAAQTSDLQLKLTVTPPTAAAGSVKTQFHITTDMERVTDTATTTTAKPAPGDEPPTGQLQ